MRNKVRIGLNMCSGILLVLTMYLIVQGIRCSIAIKSGADEVKVILSMHGMFGGYDQGYDTCKDFVNNYRIIAPSRFGYLGSDVMGNGTAAIRFALDYPERTNGPILYCSSMPLPEKLEKYSQYIGPPSFLCNNYAMFLISPLFEPIMGMEPSTIYSMMPINERSSGSNFYEVTLKRRRNSQSVTLSQKHFTWCSIICSMKF